MLVMTPRVADRKGDAGLFVVGAPSLEDLLCAFCFSCRQLSIWPIKA